MKRLFRLLLSWASRPEPGPVRTTELRRSASTAEPIFCRSTTSPAAQDHRQCSGALERDAGAGKLRSGRKTRLADPLRRRRTGRVLRDRRDLCRESGSCPQCVASFLLRRKDPGFHRLAKCGRHGIRRPGLLFLHFGRNHADPLFGPAPAFARQTELRLLRTRKHLRRRRISRPGLRVPRRRPHGP